MKKIPDAVTETDLSFILLSNGLKRTNQGKIRDTYELPDLQNFLVVATDRASIFDFVLPCLISDKGKILTAMTIFWLTTVLKNVNNHLVAYGADIDKYLPLSLQGNTELQVRALVVRKLEMLDVECIARGYLTGSGWSAYKENREICGNKLPAGLYDGSWLIEPIFTPTTKEEVGHDEPITVKSVEFLYGKGLEEFTLEIYSTLRRYALTKGIVIADTKIEIGVQDEGLKNLILADEIGTPDSSRFWDLKEWEAAAKNKKSPTNYDKQVIREWGKTVGINAKNPENEKDMMTVNELVVPVNIINETSRIYHYIFERLTGMKLEDFQENVMNIDQYHH